MPPADPGFKDHFSRDSQGYQAHRPDYPAALFAWLADQAPDRRRAWDCATGTGQAAAGLARHFKRVAASDASAAQIRAARPCPGVEYYVAGAERSALADASVALVSVAQALHWLDLERFYPEVRRVCRDGGLLAVWTYDLLRIDPPLDALLEHWYSAVLGPYWPAERRWVESGYRDLPFPFPELAAPRFHMAADWDLPRLLGYLGTWSAAQRLRQLRGSDPLPEIADAVAPLWGEPARTRRVRWPLALRVGRVES